MSWIDHKKRRPTESGWYLVWCPAGENTIANATLAWWEPGVGNGWSEIFNFNNGEKMPSPTHWQPIPTRPTRRTVQTRDEP